ncbi:hypothetical protein ONS95_007247 [Cadophora gregata]|uniref:uncharacterized protein n=1 Tax=Cadophora gregata TaxID=51156 RepID=UPI0026DC13FA|nr:uncharacterized protein ONS95_007247 [Cadophora gregata]KAK0100799.1 hypothetical protein ONS95_007247 [Cadophora gregata]KAK0117206.1 hypothetical protein ONS96_013040 [Cadophora gregata f. sp. sojae]
MATPLTNEATTAISTRLDSEADPWLIARDRYLLSLTPEERVIFQQATVENLYFETSVINSSDQQSSKVRKAIEAVQPLIEKIESYGKAMDVFANMSTTILSPIWGSIRVVLVLAGNVGRLFERFSECLGRIGDILPRLLDYQRVFSLLRYPRLKESLATMYLDIIEVCMDFKMMIKNQQQNILKRLMPSSSIEQRFKEAEKRFRAHRKIVEKEAETCHMIEEGEARDLVLRDRQLQ